MKDMTVKDIQDISLHIVKHIHEFCEVNNIKYSLAYGSLIGAIRHEGFIPWDDDLDIIMPRPDYDKFIELYSDSEEFKLLTPERHNSLKTYARLCEYKRTKSWVALPWFEGACGVWIDIFPIDGVSSDPKERILECREITKLNDDLFKARLGLRPLGEAGSIIKFAKRLVRKIQFFRYDYNSQLIRILTSMRKHPFSSSEFCGNLGFTGYIHKEGQEREIYEKFELHKFEDTYLYIPSNYDTYLRFYYGDYMKLPPLEKRAPTHSDVQRFYWR